MIDALLIGNILIMIANLRFRGGGVDRLRQLVRLFQAFRQADAADGSVLLVAGPAASCDVTTDDTLQRKHFQFPAHHAVAVEFLLLEKFRHILDIGGNHMIRKNVLRHIKPEFGHLGKHGALLGHHIVQNHIEAADAVGCHHDQAVSIVVNLSYLTFFDRFHFLHAFTPHLYDIVIVFFNGFTVPPDR